MTHLPPAHTDDARRPGRGLAGLIRSIAGSPAAWKRSRRGSFLVMVVGTLALLSVFAVLYLTIGNQDLRAKAAAVHRQNIDDVPAQFQRYVAEDIIAADATAVWVDSISLDAGATAGVRTRRESTDYPSIDWSRDSTVPTSGANFDAATVFTPVGTYLPAAVLSGQRRCLPTDPWLASTEPAYLSYLLPGNTSADGHYLLRRDWANISNVAPDGRFVNFNNLRSNFQATHNQMTQGLAIYDGAGVPSTSGNTFFGIAANRDMPAHWASFQLRAFRPVTDFAGRTAADDTYPPYQWCDTDGDGMYDSRWFEMVENADRSILALANRDVKNFIESDGSIRWFFATRIVDLSGLVNVNLAGDFRAPPTVSAPVGSGGTAEIDLRRLLTLGDAYDINKANAAAVTGLGYDAMTADPALGTLDYRGQYDVAAAVGAGRFAYNALRFSLSSGSPLPRTVPGAATLFAGPTMLADAQTAYASTGVLGAEYDFFTAGPMGGQGGPELRRRTYASRASSAFEGFRSTWTESPGTSNPDMRLMGSFGLEDQAELLTFTGSNNESVTSSLEAVLGGRDNTSTTSPDLRAFSPLRDNRSPQSERRANTPPMNAAGLSEVMTQSATDIRGQLTTISGARPFRSALGASAGRLVNAELKLDASELLESGDTRTLFTGYADALAPYAYIRDAWSDPTAAPAQRYRTAFYGHAGPELSLTVAAHMAANMRDLYDYDGTWTATTNPNTSADTNPRQSVYTLVLNDATIDRTDPNNPFIKPASHPELFPGFDTASSRRDYFYLNRGIDPNDPNADNLLGDAGSALAVPLLNVYGVEPQPFITNISTFTVYTDTPNAAGGDDEAGDGRLEATINGSIDVGNHDFLYRAVAVQITNPFDQVISVSTGSSGSVTAEYYLRLNIAGSFKTYVAAGSDDGSPTIKPIRIDPRSSVVLVILSSDVGTILGRIQTVDPGAAGQTVNTIFKNIITNDMDDSTRRSSGVYWIPTLDPVTGTTDFPTSGVDAVITTDTPVVELWRARANDRLVAGDATGDQLIDRMRMPSNASLDRRLPAGQNDIDNSDPDDDGFTLTLWSSVRRPADPSGSGPFVSGQHKEPNGSFPAFCMEPKYLDSNPNLTTWNIADDDGVVLTSVKDTDFDGTGRRHGNRRSMPAWRAALQASPVIPTLATYPGSQGSADLFGAAFASTTVDDSTRRRAESFFPATESFTAHYPLLSSDNRRFRRPSDPTSAASPQVKGLRVADLLLPLGIGPSWAPLNSAGTVYDTTDAAQMRKSWTTLSESMAAAMGYENFTLLTTTSAAPDIDPLIIYAPRQLAALPALPTFPLDRGQLWLDRFTPFVDQNGNGIFNAPQDVRGGLELPPALAVFDLFDVFPPGERTLTTMIPGRVNINTAPLPVLRTLPMLSPMTGTNPDNAQPNWWWNLPEFSTSIDLATSVQAYRDRIGVAKRYPSRAAGSNPDDVAFIDLAATALAPHAPTSVRTAAGYEGMNGRSATALIETDSGAGVNEWPGFRSIGEVFLPRQRTTAAASLGWNTNMDFLGRDNAGTTPNEDRLGVNSLIIQPDPANNNNFRTDDVRDDYAEQLATAQGLLGSTTTRSDVFAVWFVVAGFKESDVAYLGANDPVVPSVKRRFLMIVDRSNVVKQGDKPSILYFKELPVEN